MLHRKYKYIALVIASLSLSSCGFKPLYVEREGDSVWHYDGKYNTSIIQEMAKIKVEPIADRFGQLIRNDLLDSLSPQGEPKNPQYRLTVMMTNKEITQQALRNDITATRERVKYEVSYQMQKNGENLIDGNSIAFVSYDIMANPYSTTTAQKKAEENAAKIIANDIILRIGTYFNSEMLKSGEYREFQTGSN